jgi:hypothetical protein
MAKRLCHFKSGTEVTLGENAEVISGTLAKEHILPTAGVTHCYDITAGVTTEYYNFGKFKVGTTVSFNENGRVISGTLTGITFIKLTPDSIDYVVFSSGNIAFNADGSVAKGTIWKDDLCPLGWKNFLPLDDNAGFLSFAESEIQFGSHGQVVQGKIAEGFTTKSGKTFPAGTILQFSETEDPKIVK